MRRFLLSSLDSQQAPTWTSHIWLRKSANEWTLTVAGMPGYPAEILACQQLPDKDAYRCSDSQALTADAPDPYIRSIALRIANADIAGTIEMQGKGGVQTHQLMGIATVGNPGASITGCASFDDVYVGDVVNCTRAVTPSSGTWLVEDELTYKPGRGMALDVQNGMALAQVFNYLPNGAPSFHMGSGSYAGVATQFTLNRYQAGRALGGPPASAELAQTAGNLGLEFSTLSYQYSIPSRVRGSVAFPSEPQMTMVRMALEPGAGTAEGLLGQWWMGLYTDGLPEIRQPVTLSRIEGNQALSEDGQVRCQRYPEPDYTSRANCDWNHNGRAYRAYLYQQPGNRSGNVLQVRDRHGNLMGLGHVPLE